MDGWMIVAIDRCITVQDFRSSAILSDKKLQDEKVEIKMKQNGIMDQSYNHILK